MPEEFNLLNNHFRTGVIAVILTSLLLVNISPSAHSGPSTILGTTGMSGARAIIIDSSGNIYTTNENSNNVSKITPGGVSTIHGTTGSGPIEITIDSFGNIYTANSGSANVSKITLVVFQQFMAQQEVIPVQSLSTHLEITT